jgi:hypothetical protein
MRRAGVVSFRASLRGADKAVLLTMALNPSRANWLRGYVLYRFGDEVRVQERLFIIDELDYEFDLKNPSQSLSEYTSVNDDGMRISEWKSSTREIRDFLRSSLPV